MNTRFRDARRTAVAATTIVTLTSMIWVISDFAYAAAVATAMSLLFAGVTLVLDLIDRLRPAHAELDTAVAVDELADAVGREWQAEATSRGLRDDSVLRLHWAPSPQAGDSLDAVLQSSGGRPLRIKLDGELRDEFDPAVVSLATEYHKIPSRRLVLLGEPGSGKTVLAMLLTLGLVTTRQPGGACPVLLNVAGWDPVREGFDAWLIRTVAQIYYNGQPHAARELLRHGLLIPVLDGLDEIPEASRRAAVEKINLAVRGTRPVVLTCRSNEYTDAIRDGSAVLSRAPVIELKPVTVDDLERYYGSLSWRDGVKWHAVYDRMRAEPDGPLAAAMSTPLIVSLARIVYQNLTDLPQELLDADVFDSRHKVENSLIGRTVPAAYADSPKAAHAERYLRFLADYLHDHGERDLHWWKLSARKLSAWTGPILGISVGLLAMVGVAVWVATFTPPDSVPPDTTMVIGASCGATLGLLLTVAWFANADRRPGRLSFKAEGSSARLRDGFTSGAVAMAVPTVAVLAGYALTISIASVWSLRNIQSFAQAVSTAIALIVLTGVTVGVQRWFDAADLTAAPVDPLTSMLQDRRLSFVMAAVGGLAFGAAFAPTLYIGMWVGTVAEQYVTRWSGWPGSPDLWLSLDARRYDVTRLNFATPEMATAALRMLPALAVVLLTLASRAWPRYVVATWVLFARRQLPLRLARFLADAQRRGVLRRSAAAYQFRHVRLQEQLSTMDHFGQARRATATSAAARRTRFVAGLASAAVVLVALTAVVVAVVPKNTAAPALHGDYVSVLSTDDGPAAPGAIQHAVFSPDTSLIAIAESDDPRVRLFSARDATARGTFRLPYRGMYPGTLLFSPDSSTLFIEGSTDDGRSGTLCDLATRHVFTFPLPGLPDREHRIWFSRDSRVLGAIVDGEATFVDVRADKVTLSASPTPGLFLSLDNDTTPPGAVVTFDPSAVAELRTAAGRLVRRFPDVRLGDRSAIKLGATERDALTYSESDGLRLWNAASGDLIANLTRHEEDMAWGFSGEDKFVQAIDRNRVGRVWDTADGRLLVRTPPISESTVAERITYSPAGDEFAVVDTAGTIRRWNTQGHELPVIATGQEKSRITYSPDGSLVVAVVPDGDGVRYTLTPTSGSGVSIGLPSADDPPAIESKFYTDSLLALHFSDHWRIYRTADGAAGFATDLIDQDTTALLAPGLIAVWDGNKLAIVNGVNGTRLTSFAVAEDSRREDLDPYFGIARTDGVVELRDPADGHCVARLVGHAGAIAEVQMSPDGTEVATSADDGTVRLWDLAKLRAQRTC
ncbi:NACHT and WD40 repeat domain-containing protein [Mangrovihabitans endophyticus]|uniref:WD40 repeat n=1 Tax=Mangrovihabitans endophyticus TaxID=1751298 RepID=A0A8J3FPW3_9ACTN|nr:WD40 repeat domain-containing protein [Mangrovihabitans endophyticus]GGL04511.1 hypothetical protein GCM10012284_43910 [Mangrovihabitans endophyticus]